MTLAAGDKDTRVTEWPRGLIMAEALIRCGGDPAPMIDLFRMIEAGANHGAKAGWDGWDDGEG